MNNYRTQYEHVWIFIYYKIGFVFVFDVLIIIYFFEHVEFHVCVSCYLMFFLFLPILLLLLLVF